MSQSLSFSHLVWSTAVLSVFATGCKRIAPFDPYEDEAVVPGWILDEYAEVKHDCEDSLYWDTNANIASVTFAGNFFEDGDTFYGNEFWMIYPNPTLEENALSECTVVYAITGTKITSEVNGAAYAIVLEGSVDEEQTDCEANWQNVDIYAGEESFTTTYHIIETPNNGVRVSYTSGTELGIGERLSNGIQWISDPTCWGL